MTRHRSPTYLGHKEEDGTGLQQDDNTHGWYNVDLTQIFGIPTLWTFALPPLFLLVGCNNTNSFWLSTRRHPSRYCSFFGFSIRRCVFYTTLTGDLAFISQTKSQRGSDISTQSLLARSLAILSMYRHNHISARYSFNMFTLDQINQSNHHFSLSPFLPTPSPSNNRVSFPRPIAWL